LLSQLDQPFRQYVKSFYWSITVLSTVGFGDVVPYTWQEELVSIGSYIVGSCILFASLVGALSTIFSANPLQKKVADQLDELREWCMTHVKMHPRLAEQVLLQMEKSYHRDAFRESELLEALRHECVSTHEAVQTHLEERKHEGKGDFEDSTATLVNRIEKLEAQMQSQNGKLDRILEALSQQ
jgi:hypothetical protein